MSICDIKTPCFVLNKEELERSIQGFQKALNCNFSNSIVGYSVKTNSVPYCLSLANENGCYAEVVSFDEYELAIRCGFRGDRIVYNGPMKSKESFLKAIIDGAIVNIETHRELEWLRDLPQSGHYKIGIRLNVNITKVSRDDAEGDRDNSRFGFSDETEEFYNAVKLIDSLDNVTLVGLHIHRTSHSRSLDFYRNSIRYACETILKYRLKLEYLDIGGGYYGIFADKPTYQQYSDVFIEVLRSFNMHKLCIIVEPGNALVASCFKFVSEVIDVKHVEEDCWFITTDGSRNDIDPFFRKNRYMTEILTDGTGEIVQEQVISGCTCLEYDRLFTINDHPLLKVGDRICYKNVGAYTMCLTPLFIHFFPIIYVQDGEEMQLIRSRWTAEEFIQKSLFYEQ